MEIPNRQAEIDALTRKYLTDPEPDTNGEGHQRSHSGGTPELSDEEIIEFCRKAGNAAKFSDLYDAGDTSAYASASDADLGLLGILKFYTQDPDQLERLFSDSALGPRQKWRNRQDYRRRTIDKALSGLGETYAPSKGKPNPPNFPNPTNSPNRPNRPNPSVKSAAALLKTAFAPTPWAIPGVLPEGVTLLVGKPKKGKSWMALGFCEAIAAGGVALGTKKVEKGETLYLSLEDNERRMQKRLKKVLAGRECPEGLHYSTEWPRLNEGGAEALEEWLKENPGARLVVIDTLQKVRTPARGQNVYAEDYAALEVLMPIAARYGVAIVVVHHLRKGEAADPQDMISGSTGLSGGVDGYLILHKAPGSRGPTLYVEGRDIEEPEEYALHWNMNTATWTIEGTAEEVHMSEERGAILVELNRSPEPMSPKELADVMPGKSHGAVKYLLHQMYHDDQVVRVSGKYSPANPTNPPKADTYKGKEDSVSGVSGVSGVCPHETPAGYPCDDCEVEQLFGGAG